MGVETNTQTHTNTQHTMKIQMENSGELLLDCLERLALSTHATKPEYNGWTNWETWLVRVWMTNDEGSYYFWRELVEQHGGEVRELGEILETQWLEQIPEELFGTVYGDLISQGAKDVNWEEIAESWLDDVKEANQC